MLDNFNTSIISKQAQSQLENSTSMGQSKEGGYGRVWVSPESGNIPPFSTLIPKNSDCIPALDFAPMTCPCPLEDQVYGVDEMLDTQRIKYIYIYYNEQLESQQSQSIRDLKHNLYSHKYGCEYVFFSILEKRLQFFWPRIVTSFPKYKTQHP